MKSGQLDVRLQFLQKLGWMLYLYRALAKASFIPCDNAIRIAVNGTLNLQGVFKIRIIISLYCFLNIVIIYIYNFTKAAEIHDCKFYLLMR